MTILNTGNTPPAAIANNAPTHTAPPHEAPPQEAAPNPEAAIPAEISMSGGGLAVLHLLSQSGIGSANIARLVHPDAAAMIPVNQPLSQTSAYHQRAPNNNSTDIRAPWAEPARRPAAPSRFAPKDDQ